MINAQSIHEVPGAPMLGKDPRLEAITLMAQALIITNVPDQASPSVTGLPVPWELHLQIIHSFSEATRLRRVSSAPC